MENRFANVIVDITHEKLDRIFQYKIPERMQGQLFAGMVVQIPFGKSNRLIRGYVIGLTGQSEYECSKLKEIHEIATDGIGAESKLIGLAAWVREYYGATMIQALKTVLPVKQKVKQKEQKSICLLLGEQDAAEKLAFFQKKHQTARARLLEALMDTGELPAELVSGKLHISSATLRGMEEQGIIACKSVKVYRNPIKVKEGSSSRLHLNAEQDRVVNAILSEWETKPNPVYLIHGVTGSGKTEIYMELIAAAIKEGKQAIVLIPEIALTYQTVLRFYRRFGERISIMNSRLSQGERYDQYERAKKGLIDVMIGPRSAVFTPFPNLGIIIMDEEHEDSYKSETVPRYHTREVAVKRGSIEGAKVVLGSATPSVEAYYRSEQGIYKRFSIQKRVEDRVLPKVMTADMREELAAGNRSILSRRLHQMIEDRLGTGQQVMLFLNRRGYAGFLSCRSCGHVIKCAHCDVSLSLHNHGNLVCHYCGYQEEQPGKCPECGSPFLRSFRAGTQQIEELVRKEYPEARILRMDMDTTREKDGHARILAAFADGKADILIGTQMIVKGHDFPNVTLVGVLAADLSLYANDYRSGERTFQLLTQAAGRAGRGTIPGEVVIQTYDPGHYSLVAAVHQDYERFYREEILFRELAGYPPAAGMLAIHGAGEDAGHLDLAMDYLKKLVAALAKKAEAGVIGPAEESVSKIQDIYRRVLYVKHKNSKVLTMIKDKVEQYIEMNEGFKSIHIQFDMEA